MKLHRFLAMPIVAISVIVPLSSCGIHALSLDEIKMLALPSVRSYENISYDKYQITNTTRILVDSTSYANEGVAAILNNVSAQFFDKLKDFPTYLNHTPIIISVNDTTSIQPSDIYVKLVSCFPNFNQVTTPEAYQINIANSHVEISALGNQGILWGLRTILQMQITNGGTYYGLITDWPKTAYRGIQYDFSGRGFDINYLNNVIKEMSWDKLNTLGLQFASGGCHISTGRKADGSHGGNPNQTMFTVAGNTYNINSNASDPTTTWQWTDANSDFSQTIALAKRNGINIIPAMEIFGHANFITDLTTPKDASGNVKDDAAITEDEAKNDFAFYDDQSDTSHPHGHRCSGVVDLRKAKPGSNNAIDLLKQIVAYFANRFKDVGINNFSVSGDEYIEGFIWGIVAWNNIVLNDTTKQAIVNSYYDFMNDIDNNVLGGITPKSNSWQWNDDLLRNNRDQIVSTDPSYFPKPSTTQLNNSKTYLDNKYVQYWWKGKHTDCTQWGANAIASVDDLLNFGYKHIINYDFNDLYFCGDPESSMSPDPQALFNNWHPGMFPKNWEDGTGGVLNDGVYQTYNENTTTHEYADWISGAMFSVWYDYFPELLDQTYLPMKALSQKCWNGSDTTVDYAYYARIANVLKHAPFINY